MIERHTQVIVRESHSSTLNVPLVPRDTRGFSPMNIPDTCLRANLHSLAVLISRTTELIDASQTRIGHSDESARVQVKDATSQSEVFVLFDLVNDFTCFNSGLGHEPVLAFVARLFQTLPELIAIDNFGPFRRMVFIKFVHRLPGIIGIFILRN